MCCSALRPRLRSDCRCDTRGRGWTRDRDRGTDSSRPRSARAHGAPVAARPPESLSLSRLWRCGVRRAQSRLSERRPSRRTAQPRASQVGSRPLLGGRNESAPWHARQGALIRLRTDPSLRPVGDQLRDPRGAVDRCSDAREQCERHELGAAQAALLRGFPAPARFPRVLGAFFALELADFFDPMPDAPRPPREGPRSGRRLLANANAS